MLLFSEGLWFWKSLILLLLFLIALGWSLWKGTRSTTYLYWTLAGIALALVWIGVFTSPVILGILLFIMASSVFLAMRDKS